MRPLLCLLFVVVLGSCATNTTPRLEAKPTYAGARWLKGNTHTHTTRSDGDSTPEEVARWYKERGYDFLVLSDHNVLVDPAEAAVGDDNFLIIPGEDVTAVFPTEELKRLPIHINGLDIDYLVMPDNSQPTITAALQANINNIRAANGLPHINHPNFHFAITHENLFDVQYCNLVEIYNGHPLVNNAGNDTHPGMEEVWDILLTKGKQMYGIGVDDAHHFKGEFKPERSNPGRCWVMVRANALEKEEILRCLEQGEFYFTTGALIDDVRITPGAYAIDLPDNSDSRTDFIGRGGRLLLSTTDDPAVYTPQGDELYVRAKVHAADGKVAWTQPVFLGE